jgi:hypothetical protein
MISRVSSPVGGMKRLTKRRHTTVSWRMAMTLIITQGSQRFEAAKTGYYSITKICSSFFIFGVGQCTLSVNEKGYQGDKRELWNNSSVWVSFA